MNFPKTAFCKTCHLSDHLEECYSKGHQITDLANNKFPPYNQRDAEELD